MKRYKVTVTVAGKGDEVRYLNIPDQASEITLLQWCRVQEIELPPELLPPDEKQKAGKVELPHSITSWFSVLEYARKVLRLFDVDDTAVFNADLSELSEEQGDGVVAMFIDLLSAVNGYRPKYREQFKHRGKFYTFPENVQQSFGQMLIGGKMTMGQAADALQLDHALSHRDAAGNPLMEDQQYKRDLAVISALSREVINGEPERPPLDWVDRRKWLDNRMEVFADLPMDVALDGCFFLSSLKVRLLSMISSALRLRTSLVAQRSLVR